MKKFWAVLILLLSTTFGLFAQSGTENERKPVASFDKTEHNYGTIEKGANGECTFSYTNTGQAPLILSNVRSSCGCTVPKWSKEPLMPGQSAQLTVRYNTNTVGPINRTITVESNSIPASVVLRIVGTVIAPPDSGTEK